MATQPHTHSDYTVGWVCALAKEQIAAIAMLDERHPKLPKPPNDDNTYILGSIGHHNIVISCLPAGKIGLVSAATVATHMIHAFPSIKFALMVGIGGGIPPQVMLGDVVVGIPTGQYPGVVQWDLGKEQKGGEFTRTGSLNNPPRSLLGAVSELRAEHDLQGSKIPSYLSDMAMKYPRLASKYLRSESLQDVLFKAAYDHNEATLHPTDAQVLEEEDDDDDDNEEEEDSCRYCDKTQIVRRKPRDMRIHYGSIASGNKVIKNAAFRNNLRRDLGKDVLCIEMEAAGLMENFPCLVIRGICDYADSHKNKAWQEHAAAMAAAYAKELLGYVQPSDVDKKRAVKDILHSIQSDTTMIKDDTTYTRSYLNKKEDIEILDWLIPTDYGPQQTDYLRRRQPGTGQWLLNSEEYQSWIKEPNKTLFCPGIPGAGKTILTSIVVNDLENKFRSETTAAIAYIYCDYKRQSEQTVENLLSSLLKQLAQSQPSLLHNLRELCDRHKGKRTRPSLDEVIKSLESVVLLSTRVFVIIDALDECQVSDGCRTKFLSAIFNLQFKTRVNLFATSRMVPEIMQRFEETLSIEICATEEDIRKYLQGRLSELPRFVSTQPLLQDEITTSITKTVDRMFLLAQLHFDSLKGEDTSKAIRTTLRKLAAGSNTYDAAYNLAMERIEGQLQKQAERAKQVLSWITCTKRPLTQLELLHALAIETDELDFDQENLPQIEDMVSICAGLVTIDQESSIVRLVHYTTQDYFARSQSRWFPAAQLSITTVCTTYLSYRKFEDGYARTNEEFEERLRLYPLYDYAAHHWGHHGREVPACQNIISFLQQPAKVEASSQVLMIYKGDTVGNYSQDFPRQMTGLHLAAYFGLKEAVATLLGQFDVNLRDSYDQTSLSLAAERGYEAPVRLLLATEGVDSESRDQDGRTPLSLAAENGHEVVVKLLLDTGKVNADDWENYAGRTPLGWAAKNGHKAVVKLLLDSGKVDVNVNDDDGETPLSLAAERGHEAIVRLLIDTEKIDADIRYDNGRTWLSFAAEQGDEAVVKLLLDTGKVNPNSKDEKGWTPLLWAVKSGHSAIVKLLLNAEKAVPNSKETLYSQALFLASARGFVAIVKLLLDTGKADINSKINSGQTPLLWAARHGHEAVVRLLLATKGIDPDSKTNDGWTPLLQAAESGHEAVVQLLLATETVDADARDEGGRTPLSWAAKEGHEAVVRLLLQAGADRNTVDNNGLTTLQHAALNHHNAVELLLLDSGASISSDFYGSRHLFIDDLE